MDHPNPLDVGELIAQCIDHLGDSSQDLKACALVSRRWVYAAQSQLFKAVTVSITHVDYVAPGGASAGAIYWARFLGTLRRSSHLTRHIQTLNLMGNGDPAVIPALSQICNFPFTHLENVFIFVTGYLTFPHAVAFQPLLSVPTLRRVKSFFTFKQISNFVQIWDGCAPGVRHVELFFEAGASSQQSSQAPPPPAHIVLESLRMTSEGMTDYRMTHNLRLFDLSRLRVLSIHRRTEFPWQHCSQTLQGIEALDIFSNVRNSSTFLLDIPNVAFFKAFFDGNQPLLLPQTLISPDFCTIRSAHCSPNPL
ncbi:hypothetical protein B0H19DRAFT_1185672 [Mycena capillaripes]|nr:hypothetical protein B0H19DRAFT_1185672 [Mycena capillaripes]